MAELTHRIVPLVEVRIHAVEAGPADGPMVLMVHGFPESWFSWRHQLDALGAAGYRAVAIDVRGYGRSSQPAEIDAYGMLRHVGDNVGVVRGLGAERAVVVGHDWGAPIAWNSALLRPDVFVAVAGLSVPYSTRSDARPLARMRQMAGDAGEFYIEYFQEPGRAEAEAEVDVRDWLLAFYHSASGDATALADGSMAVVPTGRRMRDQMSVPDGLPSWLPEEDFEFYVDEFERTGFTGGLNRYRNIDRDWRDLAAFTFAPITVPALFIGGSKDGPTLWGAPAIERFPETLPMLRRSEILDGCGHWTQQERPDEVNGLLLEFLAGLDL